MENKLSPSPFQQAIYDFVATGTGSAIINAVAGSGKTTTICTAAKLLVPGGNYWFGAFSKNIAEELKGRLPYFVQTSTFHSKCLAAYQKQFGYVKRELNKTKWLCQDAKLIPEREFWKVFPYVERLVSFAKGTTTPISAIDFNAIIDHHDMDEPPPRATEIARELLYESLADLDRLDFDDMLWMTFHRNVEFVPKNDFIFVDEAQDLSSIQHELLARMLKPDGRLIAVGDKHQAIYGFRGAHTNGMDELRSRFNAVELPLSISYRCSQAVVKEAQRILGPEHHSCDEKPTNHRFLAEEDLQDEVYDPFEGDWIP